MFSIVKKPQLKYSLFQIARTNQYDTYGLKDIYKQYGDHLYAKRDYSGAIENYVRTTGHLEPSYVIRKFLDIHRINDLTTYLKALHMNKEANKDHTILLLNCYTKLKDEESLKEFVYPRSGHRLNFFGLLFVLPLIGKDIVLFRSFQ